MERSINTSIWPRAFRLGPPRTRHPGTARALLLSTLARICLVATLTLGFLWDTAAQAAEQRFSVKEDGLVRMKASVTGITRVSVVGDRIASIVNDNDASVYQVRNDDKTGDLFLRYVGPEGLPEKEGGYLVTEKGRTVAYEILPIRASTQTAIITIKPHEAEVTASSSMGSGDFAETSFGAGDGYAAQLTAATRETIATKIHAATPGKGRNGALISSHRIGDLVGEVRVASAGGDGRLVKEQEFYKPGVLSVWIQRKSLGAGERSWVVVVRKK